MGRKKKSTVGYRYYLGLFMGLCRGPVDAIVEVKVGDRTAWNNHVGFNTVVPIEEPDLFGGEEKEGGIVGTMAVLMGAATQAVYGPLEAMIGTLTGAFRGVTTVFFNGYIGTSPYPKAWAFRVQRAWQGWDEGGWYIETARIDLGLEGGIRAMNPAHILYECFTNRDWGRGLPRNRIDDESWRAIADVLYYDEQFGLCMKWMRQGPIEEFMQSVIDHIGAVHYVDRRTGLLKLKLIRYDYVPEDLPLFTPETGLLSIDDESSVAQSSGTNEMQVKYRDPITNKDRTVRVKNLAAMRSAGGAVSSTTKEYTGLPTPALALRVAQRDLKANSGFIKKFKLQLDRRAYDLVPGSPFRIQDLSRGIDNMILRVGQVEWGSLVDGTVTVEALQDVFGLPFAGYVEEQLPEWSPPNNFPVEPTEFQLLEMPYREIVQSVGPSDLATVGPTACYLGAIAVRPTALSQGFDLVARVGLGSFKLEGDAPFCPAATIADPTSKEATSITVSDGVMLTSVDLGSAALIDGEIVRVDAFDLVAGTVEIARGCGDTVPAVHDAGARIYFFDTSIANGTTEYATGVTVEAQLLTRSSGGVATGATITDLTFNQRQFRPYPPGLFRINGEAAPLEATGALELTWAHRDRVGQDDQLVDTEQASIGPEAGTTYTARMRRVDTQVVIAEVTGEAGDTATLEAAYTGDVVIELLAVRDGLDSWQTHRTPLSYIEEPPPP